MLRYLIRLPFLLSLTFLIAIWLTSHFGSLMLHRFSAGRGWGINAVQGLGHIFNGDYPTYVQPLRFYFARGVTADGALGGPGRHGKFGFYLDPAWHLPHDFRIIFPLWLPTLLLAAVTCFVWRKTSPKSPARAFPIEPTANAQ